MCAKCLSTSCPCPINTIMCLGGHSSQDLQQHMKEERNNSPTTNRQGGMDIDLLHIFARPESTSRSSAICSTNKIESCSESPSSRRGSSCRRSACRWTRPESSRCSTTELPVHACTPPGRSREPSQEDKDRLRQRRLKHWRRDPTDAHANRRPEPSMNWGLTEHPDGPRISLCGPLLAEKDGLSRSRENISASGWRIMGTTPKALDG